MFSGPGTARAAKQWRAEALTALSCRALRAPTRRTFREEADDWQRRAEAGEAFTRSGRPYNARVVRLVAADCRNYVNPEFGSARLGDITRRDVQGLVDGLRAAKDDDGNPKHSSSKVRSVITSLKIVLRRPLEDDEIQVDPTGRLRLPPPPEAREWEGTPERAAALVAALPESLRALYATAAYTGLRRADASCDEGVGLSITRRAIIDVLGEVPDTLAELHGVLVTEHMNGSLGNMA
jgi:hypothetical protein